MQRAGCPCQLLDLDASRDDASLDAQRMATQTDLSMLDVALRCGFASRSTFSNVFRSRTGMASSRFRESHRQVSA